VNRGPRRRRLRQPETRQRILEAATRLFAAQGFRRVTVRDICREAGANVAAVNYHFGDKMGLYTTVVDEAVSAIRDVAAEVSRLGAGRPAGDRLAIYVRVHCQRLFALGTRDARKASLLQQLIHREMQDPTPALEELIDGAFRPRFEYLAAIVGELLGAPGDDPRVIQCATSVHAQVLTFRPSPFLDRMSRPVKRAFGVNRVITHITSFSLAGIRAYQA
jgi:AcrR family transcriptional regulator